MHTVSGSQNGSIAVLPVRVKAPGINAVHHLSLPDTCIQASVFSRTNIPGLIMCHLAKRRFCSPVFLLPVSQQFLGFCFAAQPGLLITGNRSIPGNRHIFTFRNQQNLTKIHGTAFYCIFRSMLDVISIHFFPDRFNLIASLGKIHISPVIVFRKRQKIFPVRSECQRSHLGSVSISPLLRQLIQLFRKGLQICLVHTIGLIEGMIAIEHFRSRLPLHINFVIFLIGLICLFRCQRNLCTVLHQSLRRMPGVQCLFQKILLPGIDTAVNFADLYIQRTVKIRCRLLVFLSVPGNFCPIPSLQLCIGQFFHT